jgi:Ca-activated chloride channel family protein
MEFSFYNPLFLIGLLLVPLYLYSYLRGRKETAVRFSSIRLPKEINPGPGSPLRHSPAALRALSLVFLVLALARPRQGIRETRFAEEGIEIVIAIDVSNSMLAEDFTWGGRRMNRLAVAKEVIAPFIRERRGDRIGLVVFAGRAYTQCPLTVDYGILLDLLEKVEIGMVEDQTAIGSAIVTGLNRLRQTEAESKIIILLTDGENNAGKIDPLTAARLAAGLEVKIYPVGIGSNQPVPYPVRDPWTGRTIFQDVIIPLNDRSLAEIAETTGGEYFRAAETGTLEKIFARIDEMEKTPAEAVIFTEYRELFPGFIAAGLFALLAGVILSQTRFRRLP